MLKKRYTIRKKKDFKKILKQKKAFRGKYFIVKKIENDLDYSRLGVIISTKVSKKAVVRNKIKRQIKACFKEFLTDDSFKNFNLVFVVFPGFQEKGIIELKSKIKKILI